MFHRIFTFLFVFLIMSVYQIHAEDNICISASKLVNMTEVEAKEVFGKDLRNYHFSGSGVIRDIKGDPKDSWLDFYVSCGNDVIINFSTKNAGLITAYKIGQPVKFSGRCIKMKKGVYSNAPQRYVKLTFENMSLFEK